jgi:hypothetical protein
VISSEQDSRMPLALDIGTSRIVAARFVGRRYVYETQLNAFVTLPHSEATENILVEQKVLYEKRDSEFVVAGNDAHPFAEALHLDIRHPMVGGVLNRREPYSLGVLGLIITGLIGRAAGPGQQVFFSVPAPPFNGEDGIAHHETSLAGILRGLGYEPTPVQQGLAAAFGELESSNFTGVAVAWGSGLCNVCVSVLGLPVVNFSLPKAGDYIDAQAALTTGELPARLRVYKEQSFHLNGISRDRLQNALTAHCEDAIRTVVGALEQSVSFVGQLPKLDRPVPLVLTGGTALAPGFLERFEKELRSHQIALPISEVRLAADPLCSAARGALVAALC